MWLLILIAVIAVVAFSIVNSNNHSNDSEKATSKEKSMTSRALSLSSSEDNQSSKAVQIKKGDTKTASGLKVHFDGVKATALSYLVLGNLAQYDITVTNTTSKDMHIAVEGNESDAITSGTEGLRGVFTTNTGTTGRWALGSSLINGDNVSDTLKSIDWISNNLTADKTLFYGTESTGVGSFLFWKLTPGQKVSGSILGAESDQTDIGNSVLSINPRSIGISKESVETLSKNLKNQQDQQIKIS